MLKQRENTASPPIIQTSYLHDGLAIEPVYFYHLSINKNILSVIRYKNNRIIVIVIRILEYQYILPHVTMCCYLYLPKGTDQRCSSEDTAALWRCYPSPNTGESQGLAARSLDPGTP